MMSSLAIYKESKRFIIYSQWEEVGAYPKKKREEVGEHSTRL